MASFVYNMKFDDTLRDLYDPGVRENEYDIFKGYELFSENERTVLKYTSKWFHPRRELTRSVKRVELNINPYRKVLDVKKSSQKSIKPNISQSLPDVFKTENNTLSGYSETIPKYLEYNGKLCRVVSITVENYVVDTNPIPTMRFQQEKEETRSESDQLTNEFVVQEYNSETDSCSESEAWNCMKLYDAESAEINKPLDGHLLKSLTQQKDEVVLKKSLQKFENFTEKTVKVEVDIAVEKERLMHKEETTPIKDEIFEKTEEFEKLIKRENLTEEERKLTVCKTDGSEIITRLKNTYGRSSSNKSENLDPRRINRKSKLTNKVTKKLNVEPLVQRDEAFYETPKLIFKTSRFGRKRHVFDVTSLNQF